MSVQKVTRLTKEEWQSKGKALFGENTDLWRFVCPGCGSIQSVGDFRPFKDDGATPDSATKECLGRYTGGVSWANTPNKKLKGRRCDYAGYGLLHISPVIVVDGEKEIECFAFDEGENTVSL